MGFFVVGGGLGGGFICGGFFGLVLTNARKPVRSIEYVIIVV